MLFFVRALAGLRFFFGLTSVRRFFLFFPGHRYTGLGPTSFVLYLYTFSRSLGLGHVQTFYGFLLRRLYSFRSILHVYVGLFLVGLFSKLVLGHRPGSSIIVSFCDQGLCRVSNGFVHRQSHVIVYYHLRFAYLGPFIETLRLS